MQHQNQNQDESGEKNTVLWLNKKSDYQQLLYAEQAQSHGLQAVNTRRHALQNPTLVARFKLHNPHISLRGNHIRKQESVGNRAIPASPTMAACPPQAITQSSESVW